MNTKRILIAAGAALALGTLIGPVVLHAQDDDSDGIHDQLRIMTKILEASIGKDSLDRRPNLSVFDSKIRTEYIPTVGAIFTIPISFPLHPSKDEKGNTSEKVVEVDLWEHFSNENESAYSVSALLESSAQPSPQLEDIDVKIIGEKQALRKQLEALTVKVWGVKFGSRAEEVERLLDADRREREVRFKSNMSYMGEIPLLGVLKRGVFDLDLSIGDGKPYDPVKVSTLTHTIIETIAQYGHRLKSLQNSERILVVLEAPGLRGPAKPVEVSTVLEPTGNRSTQAPQTMEKTVADLLEERRKLDHVWARKVAAEKQGQVIVMLQDQMARSTGLSIFPIEEHYDRRLLAFKKSDLQQQKSYDSIKGKVETTDY